MPQPKSNSHIRPGDDSCTWGLGAIIICWRCSGTTGKKITFRNRRLKSWWFVYVWIAVSLLLINQGSYFHRFNFSMLAAFWGIEFWIGNYHPFWGISMVRCFRSKELPWFGGASGTGLGNSALGGDDGCCDDLRAPTTIYWWKYTYIWMFPKIGGTPQIIHFNRVFHYNHRLQYPFGCFRK